MTERRAVTQIAAARAAAEPTGLTLTGYAATTNTWYEVGFFQEILVPGAFKRTLSEGPDVVLLLGHGRSGAGLPLARTTAGTLSLVEDDLGLRFTADLDPADPDSQTLVRKLQRGDLDGQSSFAFQATNDAWNADLTKRTVTAVGLHRGDVSIVTHGANDKTSAWIAEAAPRAAVTTRRAAVDYTTAARRDFEAMKRELR